MRSHRMPLAVFLVSIETHAENSALCTSRVDAMVSETPSEFT